jgi:hypothetical protein
MYCWRGNNSLRQSMAGGIVCVCVCERESVCVREKEKERRKEEEKNRVTQKQMIGHDAKASGWLFTTGTL